MLYIAFADLNRPKLNITIICCVRIISKELCNRFTAYMRYITFKSAHARLFYVAVHYCKQRLISKLY